MGHEVSADARDKYAQSQGNLSSDFDPPTELSAYEGSGRPVGGPPPSGGAHGKSTTSSDDAAAGKDLIAALTDEEDTDEHANAIFYP